MTTRHSESGSFSCAASGGPGLGNFRCRLNIAWSKRFILIVRLWLLHLKTSSPNSSKLSNQIGSDTKYTRSGAALIREGWRHTPHQAPAVFPLATLREETWSARHSHSPTCLQTSKSSPAVKVRSRGRAVSRSVWRVRAAPQRRICFTRIPDPCHSPAPLTANAITCNTRKA